MRSCAAAIAVSVDEALGILTFVGNHASVSATRVACVSFVQTLKQR